MDYSKLPLDANERSAYEFQQRRHDEWKENYALFRNKPTVNRLTQRQAVSMPLTKATINTIRANTDEFSELEFEELGNDKSKQIMVNELWKDTVRNDKLLLKDLLDKKQEFLYGRSWTKLNIVDGRLTVEVREPYDVLVDRFADPSDIDNTASFFIEMGIYRTLDQLVNNPMFDKQAVNRLRAFYFTKQGLVKADSVTDQMQAKNQRLEDLGVTDINNPQLGTTVVELKLHYIKDEDNIWHVVIKADGEILAGKTLKELIGVNFPPFITWADDIERNDIYSDGVADTVRVPNQVINAWFSQLVENRTLRNFGMQFYDATAAKGWIPSGMEPTPFGWYPLPGKPSEVLQKADIPDLSESLDEINYVKQMVEQATAATATTKGDTSTPKITLGEVEIAVNQAMERISGITKYVSLARQELGNKWVKMLLANSDRLTSVKLYKKSAQGNYFKQTVYPSALRSSDGYNCVAISTAEKEKKNMEGIQKLSAVKNMMPTNPILKKIVDKKLLEFASLNPDEVQQVMEYEEQAMMAPQPMNPMDNALQQQTQMLSQLTQAPQ